MAKRIPRLKKGEAPSMLEEVIANAVIDACNALLLARVVPDGCGQLVISGERMELNLSGLKQQLDTITQQQQTILNALANPNFSIVCNGDGSITASLSFPI